MAAPPDASAIRDEDARLVREAASGDPQALERLVVRAQSLARRFSRAVCGQANDADDTMQDALVKTFRYASSIQDPGAFRAWLYRTVKNACLLNRRRHAHEPANFESLDDVTVSVSGRSPEESAVSADDSRRVRDALERVPQAYREVLFLREMEGLSTREAAEVIGISEDNVKTRLRRARSSLREELAQLDGRSLLASTHGPGSSSPR